MLMMGTKKLKICTFCSAVIWVIVVLSFWVNMVQCQDLSGNGQVDDPAVQVMTQFVYSTLSNLTSVLSRQISNHSNFCIRDPDADWNKAFNFSSNLDFLASCVQKYKENVARRFCSAAEMKAYFNTFFEGSGSPNYLKPNKNCNLTSWLPGCEPGWACSLSPNQQVDLQNSHEIPSRSRDCDACCEGFFCPRGLTCMIPCPLGSYCPLATLNKDTGTCEPYNYQLPPGQTNHTCGGANLWADVASSLEMFCSAGSYCPTTIQKRACDSGHYCRMGSTSEKRCFRLTSCNPNTANQDMHAYGVMLIAATSTLLLIIYNCSDQVIAARERRLAKTREAAARSARETVKARQKWKAARDAAKKRASGLQAHISRTFSRKKSSRHPEQVKILDKTNAETDSDLHPHVHTNTPYASTSSEFPPLSKTSKGRQMEPVGLMKMMHDIEDDCQNFEPFNLEIGVTKADDHMPKGKQINTDSQIFKYAYAQLEKEKALQQQNKNLTFSGVVSRATDPEIRKRPLIEVSFTDLTVTLKANDKHLLRYVTGKIKPGRITAVMGPSGAGKTTFISALAGKAIGCKMTGAILINGKDESIHSYRKIIGFVPQDDIVHGNLTVEENLQFNAKCRLSADLSRPDKVLIVERVIESLGLQMVRDSLVGTVEKRGISGGQRKRVNVGLEMVMEPSLLILDEPTSGLDSASSQLLLRALRHEALEGVNICMVVHQPSYALFNMFDDLVLLARGGLTVYHGSAKKAEEYFSSLGINVPERVNPPDYFIDVLEGMVEPNTSTGVNYKELPIKWMLHNRYPVPPDMQQHADRLATPAVGVDQEHRTNLTGAKERSFAGELWQDVKGNMEFHRDKIRHNFLVSKDLSNRRTPGIFQQYRYFLGRVSKQRMREARLQAVDYLILLLAGACLGSLATMSDQSFGSASYIHTIIAVSLLCKIAALRSFSLDKLQYWRESSSGMSSLAYFLAKDTVDHFNTVIKPLVYLSMFYFFTNPRSTFTDNYVVLLSLVYCVTGIAYILAIFFQPGPAQLWCVLLPIVFTLVATETKDSAILKKISNLCYPKWALEAFVIANAERYYGVWLITRCGALMKSGFDLHAWTLCICLLLFAGLVSRGIAFLGMFTFKKK
ncbi:hypothetical protein SLEP1_g42564 [Rubroshorea leprosula]|uniref:ABC transporter domain-containing protein n=1 Tax=Rubroshorea leprosula TaxID=152421 RepID=A0AAV5LAA3_9ROSI|nr:hypothetical protein SLEP1_g42564 [Rubroshorea leprosula]